MFFETLFINKFELALINFRMVDTASKTGFISQIIGPVLDIEFPSGDLPKVYVALHVCYLYIMFCIFNICFVHVLIYFCQLTFLSSIRNVKAE